MNQDLKKTLWAAADNLRSSMDAAEYKHIVLGLIFVKYISDAFDERRAQLLVAFADEANDLHLPDLADHADALEERDYYTMANVFWVPASARWEAIRAQAKQADIGVRIDAALRRGENLGLNSDEMAFYDARAMNETAVRDLGDETLKKIADELTLSLRTSVTVDWSKRETMRAKPRVMVKTLLRRYKYPPYRQEEATKTVLRQAESLSAEWVA